MDVERPKLLIVEGPGVPAEALATALGEAYDVAVTTPDQHVGLRDTGADVVMAAAAQLPVLVGELANERAITLLNAIGEGVCLATRKGEFVWNNDFFSAIDADSRKHIGAVAREAGDWFVTELKRRASGRSQQNTTEPPAAKFEFSSADDRRVFEVYVTPVPSAGSGTGDPIEHIAIAVRDVTAAKRFRRKMDAIDRAGSELVSLEADQLSKLNALERLKFCEQKIVQYTHDLLNFDHFAIFLVDDRAKKLELVISSGLPKEIEDLDLFIESDGSGISGMVAQTGKSYICTDAGTDEKYIPGLAGCRSSLTVPLRLNDKVIGVFDVESRSPGAFTQDDRQFAEIFARHIALALHMLDLLVSERCSTNQAVSGRVQGEINEPLDDILHETDVLLDGITAADPENAEHIRRIRSDVEAIRDRMKNVTDGPQTLLGVERALHDTKREELFEGRRVLVADDALKIRRVIGDMLKHRGCEVTVCEDGGAAIRAIDDAEQPFDLIISDIKMPDHNGYEVYSAARARSTETPVILMTGFGYDPHHSIVRASQEGLQSVLFKPFDIDQLLGQVRAVFGNQQEQHA